MINKLILLVLVLILAGCSTAKPHYGRIYDFRFSVNGDDLNKEIDKIYKILNEK